MKHLTANDLATRWGMHVTTLANWRVRGKGPKFVKIGFKVLYRLEDVEAYERAHLQKSTVG